MPMRLARTKTRTETGFEHVLRSLNVLTPFGQKALKSMNPFYPGDEDRLRQEMDDMDRICLLVKSDQERTVSLQELFMEMKDVSRSLTRSKDNVLTVVELFEIKSLLLQMMKYRELMEPVENFPGRFLLEDTVELLNVLDPQKDRINTFYLYDEFSSRLGELRREKRDTEIAARRIKKGIKRQLEAEYGFTMTPKFEISVDKLDKQGVERLRAIPELTLAEEDYRNLTFILGENEETSRFLRKIDELSAEIEAEEFRIRERLSAIVSPWEEKLVENCRRLGTLDLTLAKAIYAGEYQCVRPEIADEHVLEIEEGRNLALEEVLRKTGKKIHPVSFSLTNGVTCITGANMGGKTISLKLAGMCALLAQYGFFLPCKRARVGLSGYIHILIGDSQNLNRGLSSFGSDMEELKDALEECRDRAMLLIDELAAGTNPEEGMALMKGLVDYLYDKPYISMLTTHYALSASGRVIRRLQVKGLAEADFDKLMREIRYANKKQRISIINKYIDYSLTEVSEEKEIPREALNIATMLGVPPEIIYRARLHLKNEESQEGRE